jgi:hypothetical protein
LRLCFISCIIGGTPLVRSVGYREIRVKTTFIVLAVIMVLPACSRQSDEDAALRAKIIGTWTTADVVLPDQAQVSCQRTVKTSHVGSNQNQPV